MAKYVISPSLLAANFADLKQTLNLLKEQKITHLHLDVMDGHFVPAISFGLPVIQSIKESYDFYLDAHLMVSNPLKQIPQFIKANVDGITIHVEAGKTSDIKEALQQIKAAKIKAGLSLKPSTAVKELLPFKEDINLVLLMSVEPGAGGQSFMPESLERAKEIKALLPDVELQIDGGINKDTLKQVQNSGATNFVAGTALLNGDIKKNLDTFKTILEMGA